MRRGLTAVVCLAALACATPEADAARAWGPAQAVVAGDGMPMNGRLRAEYTSRGELVVASAGAPAAVAVRSPGGSGFGPAFVLGEYRSRDIRVAVDGAGGAVVAWTGPDDKPRTASRPAGGAWQVQPAPAEGVRGFAVAAGPAGQVAMAVDGAYPTIERQGLFLAYRGPGGSFEPPITLGLPQGFAVNEPDVAVSSDGTALAVWQENRPGGQLVRGLQRLPSGAVIGPVTLSRPGREASSPRVAADGAGRAMAAWVETPLHGSSGPVVTAPVAPGQGFGPARETATQAYENGLRLRAVERGAAIVSFFGTDRSLAERGASPHGPTVVAADMASGASTGGVRLSPGPPQFYPLAANADGDVAVPVLYGSQGIAVSRRAPGAGFQDLQGIRCPTGNPVLQDAALSPAGDLSVFFAEGIFSQVNYMAEDRPAAHGPNCLSARTRPARRALLALQARMPRGGRLRRGRWLDLQVFCGRPCRIGAEGKVKVAGRRARLKLGSVVARRTRAGTSRVRVGLTRKDARVVRRALSRRRTAKARVRVAGSAGASGRVLIFNVRLRR